MSGQLVDVSQTYRDEEGLPYRWAPVYPTTPNGNAHQVDDDGDPVVDLRLAHLRGRVLTSDELDLLKPPAALVDGILLRNSLAVLYGRPGSFKTFIALSWSLCIATGRGWMGRGVQRGRVLYIVGEGGSGMGQRKRAWQHDRNEPDVSGVAWLPVPVSLLDAQWSEALVQLVAEGAYDLVVIDTLSRSMPGGDENSPRDMSTVVDNADRVRQASRACVLVVHHTPKDGGTIRGHSALEGAADSTFEARADGDSTIKLTVVKQKDLPSGEVILLRANTVLDSVVIHCHDGRGSTSDSEARLLEVIGSTCGSEGLSTTALLKASEMPERTFYRGLKALRENGLVVNVGTEKQPRWAMRTVVAE